MSELGESSPPIQVSVVVPVYNSEGCVAELVHRLRVAISASGRSFEILLVNDASSDRSWDRIRETTARVHEVVGINLRRNFGQDCAIMAGLGRARGAAVVIMDDDLQHDPDDVPRLVSMVEQGHDVCCARFDTKRQARWKNFGSWFNGKVANVVLDKPDELYLSPFKALSIQIVREVIKYDGPFPYVDGLILRVTKQVTQVEASHHQRFEGRSNYGLLGSVGVWLRVATGFSLAPLRLATYVGFTFSVIGLLLGLVFAVRRFAAVETPLGWASTMVAILVLGGVQLASIGLIGEYLGRVFLHLNKTPQYVVRDIVAGAPPDGERAPISER